MRFLVSPNTDEYMDRNSLWGLVRALRAAGHETFFSAWALDGFETAPICRELGIDVLFQLNRGRPHDLPKNIRHVAWFQDQPSIPPDVAERVQPSDIIYRLIPPTNYEPPTKGRCFEGYLQLAIDETMIDAYVAPAKKTVDFSFCGTMLPPFSYPNSSFTPPANLPRSAWKRAILSAYLRSLNSPFAKTRVGRLLLSTARRASRGRLPVASFPPNTMRAILHVAELFDDPLSGVWKPERLVQKMREIISPRMPALSEEVAADLEYRYAAHALEVPRLMQRFLLVEAILHITNSVELYGVNWNLHPMFAPYHKGIVTGPQALFDVYARSRLNGAYTSRSFLHRRILECMGVGGFLFSNASVNDSAPGGLHNYFEPGVHYGEYTAYNIQEEARRWIRDEPQRKQIEVQGAAAVRKQHLWRHRVEQLLADLRRN